MRRFLAAGPVAITMLLLGAGPLLACGGLIGPNGAVNLLRTTTFAGYHDGVEHYVTAFQFAGGEGEFGSLVPLPGVPTKVEKGGDWTLQRLVLETAPARFEAVASRASADRARELMKVRIDALGVTILEGGANEVGTWATEHGFRLPPDAPEVLDFYARRSPIFLAAVFDADAARARGQQVGDGTPVHVTIPTDNPWVPLRILALGKNPAEPVEADLFLLTDEKPALLPLTDGVFVTHDQAAGASLLDDLRSDRGMEWVPGSAWLTQVVVASTAADLTFDLAIDASGAASPSPVDAGLAMPPPAADPRPALALLLVAAAIVSLGALGSRFIGAGRATAAGA